MTVQRLRAMLDERPFRAFDIHTSDGRTVRVTSPEFAWIHPFGRTMYVCPDLEVDADEVIDLLHVTKLSQGSQRRNGKRRR